MLNSVAWPSGRYVDSLRSIPASELLSFPSHDHMFDINITVENNVLSVLLSSVAIAK